MFLNEIQLYFTTNGKNTKPRLTKTAQYKIVASNI